MNKQKKAIPIMARPKNSARQAQNVLNWTREGAILFGKRRQMRQTGRLLLSLDTCFCFYLDVERDRRKKEKKSAQH